MAKAGMRRPSPYDADNHGTENHHKMKHPKMSRPRFRKSRGLPKTATPKQALSMLPTGQETIIKQESIKDRKRRAWSYPAPACRSLSTPPHPSKRFTSSPFISTASRASASSSILHEGFLFRVLIIRLLHCPSFSPLLSCALHSGSFHEQPHCHNPSSRAAIIRARCRFMAAVSSSI